MQSTMDSWQFENFSTAELSPPISPAPPSPTLYHHVNNAPLSPYTTSPTCFDKDINAFQTQKVMLQEKDPQLQQASFRQSRAQVATSILKDLEQLGDLKFKNEPDYGSNWLEESVNLELFEELSEFAYTPVSSDGISQDLVVQTSYSPVSTDSHLSELSMLHTSVPQEAQTGYVQEENFDQLKAEFQAILESLPTESSSYGDVIDIVGIKTTLVGDEEMISFDVAEESISNDMEVEMEMEVSSTEDDSIDLIDEKEVLLIDEKEFNISSPYERSPVYSTISEDEDDIEANTAEKILDALLQGNLQEAESYIPAEVTPVESRIVPLSIEDETSSFSTISETPTIVTITKRSPANKTESKSATQKAKTERRGRKPGSSKKSMAYLTDKALRKKEQNKTAATRYRQKKKQETNCTLEIEMEMQSENDELAKQKEDLQRQILMIKQLLKEVVHAKKAQVPKKVTTNRRKL